MAIGYQCTKTLFDIMSNRLNHGLQQIDIIIG